MLYYVIYEVIKKNEEEEVMKKLVLSLLVISVIVFGGCGSSSGGGTNTGPLVVYFEKPADWTNPSVYFYSTDSGLEIEWDEAPVMTEYEEADGWYMYEFEDGIGSARIIFKDNSGNQMPPTGVNGKEISEPTWFFSDYDTNVTSNPFVDSTPTILTSPAGTDFIDTLELSINLVSVEEVTELYYTLDGTDYDIDMETPRIVLGEDLEIGDTLQFTITAVNIHGTTTNEYTYIKTIDETLEKKTAHNELRIYQIMVEAYRDGEAGGYGVGYGPSHHNGDIRGIIEALDYIDDLGMNAIWLTPVFHSYTLEKKLQATGYFCDDYYTVDPLFGSNDDLKELIDEAHKRGIYVILDGVFGHHGSKKIDGVVDYEQTDINSYNVSYPESLDFYTDVATYWIDEYEIDGWRLDQAYQLYQSGTNYWKYIRRAVESLAEEREASGKEWGTLGYMVGEIWDGGGSQIDSQGLSQNGLRSCFDFPMRYSLVQVLATQEDYTASYAMDQPASRLNNTFYSVNENYPDYAQMNMFITNHDVVRFGDLLQRAGKTNYYWERHKLALGFMAAYTGPITLYYGDEYGDEVDGFVYEGDKDYYDDHSARSSGRIDGFDAQEQDLIDYTKKLMALREQYSSLWNGTRVNLIADDKFYADLKTDNESKIIYVMNITENSQEIELDFSNLDFEVNELEDLITGEILPISSSTFTDNMKALTSRFLLIK